jgi:hypothetical protein
MEFAFRVANSFIASFLQDRVNLPWRAPRPPHEEQAELRLTFFERRAMSQGHPQLSVVSRQLSVFKYAGLASPWLTVPWIAVRVADLRQLVAGQRRFQGRVFRPLTHGDGAA